MLLEISAVNGQTMYDLSLQSYGTLDRLLKLCVDNNIDNVNYLPKTGQIFVYDDSLVVNQQITGFVFATANI